MIEVARLLLAAVFAVAGVAKLADRDGSRRAARDFGVPERLVAPFALLLPLAELAIAAALIPGPSAQVAAVGAAAMFVLFTLVLGRALIRGRKLDCHCFGRLHSAPAGWGTLARNAALAGVSVAVATQAAANPTWTEAGAAGAIVAVAAQALLALTLLRRYGQALRRIEELEQHVPQTPALAEGDRAPAFSLPDVDGGRVALADMVARARPVVLVFTDPSCAPCRALLPDMARWQRDHDDRLTIAVVSRGEVSDNRALAKEHGLANVLLQDDREVADAYGVEATPSAVVVGPDGRVALPLGAGRKTIADLVQATIAADVVRERGRGSDKRVAAAAAVAAGLAPATLADAARWPARVPSDPELRSFDAAFKAGLRRLGPASQRSTKAIYAHSVRGATAQRAKRATALRALDAERREILALRTRIARLTATNAASKNVKRLLLASLLHLARSVQRRQEAMAAAPEKALRLIAESEKLLLRAVVPVVNAAVILRDAG